MQVEKSVARGRAVIYIGGPMSRGYGLDLRASGKRASDFFVLPDCRPKIIPSLPKDLQSPPQEPPFHLVLPGHCLGECTTSNGGAEYENNGNCQADCGHPQDDNKSRLLRRLFAIALDVIHHQEQYGRAQKEKIA